MIRIRTSDAEDNTIRFGCDPVMEAPNLLLLAKSLGIDVVGVSFHFDNEVTEAKTFQKAIAIAREIFDFATTLAYDFDVLDFGDGFPVVEGTVFDKVRISFLEMSFYNATFFGMYS